MLRHYRIAGIVVEMDSFGRTEKQAEAYITEMAETPDLTIKMDAQRMQLEEEDCGIQFSHTAEEQLGGQLKAGFILTDILGDTNGEGRLHEMQVETYYATRAVKP